MKHNVKECKALIVLLREVYSLIKVYFSNCQENSRFLSYQSDQEK